MLIGTRQRVCAQRVFLIVDDRLIQQPSTTKYLGVKIDSHLSWEQHIDFIVCKARSKLYFRMLSFTYQRVWLTQTASL